MHVIYPNRGHEECNAVTSNVDTYNHVRTVVINWRITASVTHDSLSQALDWYGGTRVEGYAAVPWACFNGEYTL
jgi:hypothetical protein